MNSRAIAWMSLAILAAYAAAWMMATGGDLHAAFAPFPLGGGAATTGAVAQAFALLVGGLLGWGIPGLALAALSRRDDDGAGLIGRAFGLGVGYIFMAGVATALVTGRAPERGVFLILLALPAVALLFRPRQMEAGRFIPNAVLVVALITVLMIAFWPKLRFEAFSGDGTEAYELSRSLEAGALPRWEMESVQPPRFGVPITVPFFAGAHLVFGEMNLLGAGELATRIQFLSSFAILVLLLIRLAGDRVESRMYIAFLAAVYLIWNAYFVGYEAPVDLAEPAGTDTLTVALWMAGFAELMRGSPRLAVFFMTLAAATTYSAPLLTGFILLALWWVDRPRARVFVRPLMTATVMAAVALALVAWREGAWSDWWRQFDTEYWQDLVAQERRVASLPLLGLLLLMTGGLPLVALVRYRRLTPAGMAALVAGVLYLTVVLLSSRKNLHYLAPLPWVLAIPAVEAASRRVVLAAVGILAVVVALSWPAPRSIRVDAIALGRDSCIMNLSSEAAALAADGIYQVLDWPARGQRLGIGKHTFVRYGLELGGSDCVLGLSPETPPGRVEILDGPARFWTADMDRYARWRLTSRMPMPASILFPKAPPQAYPLEAEQWPGSIDLTSDPGQALVIRNGHAMLIPAGPGDQIAVQLRATHAGAADVHINGAPSQPLALAAGDQRALIAGDWRAGWNLLRINMNAGALQFERIERR